ncbi:hypothetical protein BAE44_0008349 [Dichanthelium oligosanthes]|uniref:Uncharacterized protein n=1 Tax=Dichanthelium oligosanthes TaxID=888268 RepID=A0A1E5VZV4_9POAL|nr:hypothetical protein BAE44_0008349 [Dichanthelium oligosanthes]
MPLLPGLLRRARVPPLRRAEPEPRARWEVLFRLRAVEVAVRCVRARGMLADATERLALPWPVAGEQDVRDLLTGASDGLALAASSMKAAELFALYGASANPMLPLLSILHIPDGNHPVRLALSLFWSSRAFAENACYYLETCCVHLRTVDDVLAVPGLPDIDGLLDVERSMTHVGVKDALDLARASAALAITAHWLVI